VRGRSRARAQSHAEQGFLRGRARLVEPGTQVAQALASVIARLLSAELPGPQDAETLVPPVRRCWFRRIPGCNLWLLFTYDDDRLVLRALTNSPPVPVEDAP
jgi:hypothetical protein